MKILQVVPKPGINSTLKNLLKMTERKQRAAEEGRDRRDSKAQASRRESPL
jgi:hypothetical protein